MYPGGIPSMDNSKTEDGATVHPISSLSPKNLKPIFARIVSKTALRTWDNIKGKGKLFSMDLIDHYNEIRATAFNEEAIKFYDQIETGKTYLISKFRLKPANKKFNSLNNEFEISFTSETTVVKQEDTKIQIPEIKFDCTTLADIQKMENYSEVDAIGVCVNVGELQSFTSRISNKTFLKRNLTLVDNSNASMDLTLWGKEAEDYDTNNNVDPIIMIKKARLNEYKGEKSLSIGNGSLMLVNPENENASHLKSWYKQGTPQTSILAKKNFLTLLEAEQKNLGSVEKPDYFECKASIQQIKNTPIVYKACLQCNKKVLDRGVDQYHCDRCKTDSSSFNFRFLLQIQIEDSTSSRWVTCFNEIAEKIFGRKAAEVGEAFNSNLESSEQICSSVKSLTFVFKLSTRTEIFNDVARIKTVIESISPVNDK